MEWTASSTGGAHSQHDRRPVVVGVTIIGVDGVERTFTEPLRYRGNPT